MVWEYVNPVNSSGPMTQGSPAVHNSVFRCLRYAPDYSGFDGQTLIPQGYIEPGSTFNCDLYPVGINDFEIKLGIINSLVFFAPEFNTFEVLCLLGIHRTVPIFSIISFSLSFPRPGRLPSL